jgi:chemotaxis protein CheD
MNQASPVQPRAGHEGVEKAMTLYLGGVHASSEPLLIKTLVGSCIAVCLFDPVSKTGGMNHFMLPRGKADNLHPDATRFGVHAMDRLIAAMMKAGAQRRRLVAKVFGGAHVLNLHESEMGVPQQNIVFIRAFLGEEGIPITSEDVGGYVPRDIHCFTATGQVFVRRLTSARALERVRRQQQQNDSKPLRYGTLTMFDQE